MNLQPAVYKTETGGLLKSLMTWAIPFVYAGILTFTVVPSSLLFVACRLDLFAFLTP